MTHRYERGDIEFFIFKLRPFSALRSKFREGYTLKDLRADVLAGIVVGMVAIPLGMALAIASGVAPQYGLYTVILAGGITALLGGSRFQVTGPTAAFVVILAPIVQKFGFAGLAIAGLMAGMLLVVMGVARLGRLIEFIPHPVTTGFTAGIAIVIATLQIKDFFGLLVPHMPETYLARVGALLAARSTASGAEFGVGLLTLLLLIFWPRVSKRVPAPLIALSAATLVALALRKFSPGLEVGTIGNRFSSVVNGVTVRGIPQSPPAFAWPWNLSGPVGGRFVLDLQMIKDLIPSAFAIAMLGAIESLLSAVVADGMARTRHDPDAELVALGTSNIVCPFFGGIAATGAIARTATNIRYGARSPIAAITHAAFAFFVVLFFAPYVSYVPMASLAALLMIVAWNMSERRHFFHILKVAPRSDVAVLLLCFGLTVVFDMVIGVTFGVVVAAFLFMRRMAELTSGQAYVGGGPHEKGVELPREVMLYEIAGPLFFGAAGSAISTLDLVDDQIRAVVFNLEGVPAMDVTGLVSFESAIERLASRRIKVFVAGVREQPLRVLSKSGLIEGGALALCDTLDDALAKARASLAVT